MKQESHGLNLIRMDAVKTKTGLSRSSIYKQLRFGKFPRPVKLTPKTIAWPEHEIDAWIEALNRTFIAKLELATSQPTLSVLARIADGLNVPLPEFLQGTLTRYRKELKFADKTS